MSIADPLVVRLPADGFVPNHPDLPLLVLKHAVTEGHSAEERADAIERRYRAHGWQTAWRYGVYPFTHYHSTAHEVLGCFAGHARLRLGGEQGLVVEVQPGDVLVLPAGVGHQNLASSDDFQVCGGYPDGQEADLIRAEAPPPPDVLQRIVSVPLPASDPIAGATGALVRHWAIS